MHPLYKAFEFAGCGIRMLYIVEIVMNPTGGFSEPDRPSSIYYDQLKGISKSLN